MISHDVEIELLGGGSSDILDVLFEQARRKMMVVSTSKVVVLAIWADISFNGGMSVESTHVAIARGSESKGLGSKVTIGKHSEGNQDSGKISPHVETTGCGLENLPCSDDTISREVSIVGKKIETGAWAS